MPTKSKAERPNVSAETADLTAKSEARVWFRWQRLIVAGCVGLAFFAGLLWFQINYRPVETELKRDVFRLVQNHPELKAQWDRANADTVLTMSEADAIIQAAEQLQREQSAADDTPER